MNSLYINKCLRWLANELVGFYNRKELPPLLISKVDTFYNSIARDMDWNNLTKSDLQQLGFLSWEEDEESADRGVWFIPCWLFPAIPEGQILYRSDHTSFIFDRSTASTDMQYGCLQYGVKLKMSNVDTCLDDYTQLTLFDD